MDETDIGLVGISVTALIAVCAAIFKTATLRSRISREWSPRVYTCMAGLDELSLQAISDLYNQIQKNFSTITDKDIWPDGPPIDPLSLRQPIEVYTRALRFRTRLEKDVTRLMRIGPILVASLSVFAVSIALITLNTIDILASHTLLIIGYYLGSISFLLTTVSVCAYVILQHRLASVEVLSYGGLSDA